MRGGVQVVLYFWFRIRFEGVYYLPRFWILRWATWSYRRLGISNLTLVLLKLWWSPVILSGFCATLTFSAWCHRVWRWTSYSRVWYSLVDGYLGVVWAEVGSGELLDVVSRVVGDTFSVRVLVPLHPELLKHLLSCHVHLTGRAHFRVATTFFALSMREDRSVIVLQKWWSGYIQLLWACWVLFNDLGVSV